MRYFLIIVFAISNLVFAEIVCDQSILSMDTKDSAGIQFFIQGEFFSQSEFRRESRKQNIEVTEIDNCFVEQTFVKVCSGNYGGDSTSGSLDPIPAGIGNNYSCVGVIKGQNNISSNNSQQNGANQIDCDKLPNHSFCSGGGVQEGIGGAGKRFLQASSASSAKVALDNAMALLVDNDVNNNPNVAYGDLMYHYQGLKSPADSYNKQEQSQQDVLVNIFGCENPDIAQCTLSIPEGEMVLRDQNPDNEIKAIEYLQTQNQCDSVIGCTKNVHIGLGDMKNFYMVRPDGKTVKQEVSGNGGSGTPVEDIPEVLPTDNNVDLTLSSTAGNDKATSPSGTVPDDGGLSGSQTIVKKPIGTQ